MELGSIQRNGRYCYCDGKIGHFLDDAVTDLYQECKNEGLTKREASPLLQSD
jgi:hypothetical protein